MDQIQTVPEKKKSLWTMSYISVMVINFLTNMNFFMISTSLSVYSLELGASQALVGVIVGCFSVTALVIRPFSGVIVNRMRVLPMMIISMLGTAMACMGYYIFQNPVIFIAVRIVHGIFFCLNSTVSMVVVAKVVPKDQLSQGVAYFGLSQVLATALGPNISAAIGANISYRVSFLVPSGCMALAALFGFLLLRKDLAEDELPTPMKAKISIYELVDVKMIRLVMFSALFSAFNGLNSSYILPIGQERGIAAITMFYTVNSISVVFVRLLLGKAASKIKSFALIMIPSLASAALGCVLIGASHALPLFLVASVIQAFGQGMVQPSIQAECLKRADPGRMGTASSTFSLSGDIGQGFGVMIAGYVCGLWGYSGMYFTMAAVFALAVPLFVLLNRGKD